jgi:hypothetical protein
VEEVDERTRPSCLMKACLGVNFLSSCSSSSLSSRTTKDRREKKRERERGEKDPTKRKGKEDVTVEKIETIGIEKCIYQGDKQKKW